ncbi:MAG: hypothetical protein RL150_663 [Candidatus Parcubacteria bacterium]|jgi:hypothetical protein
MSILTIILLILGILLLLVLLAAALLALYIWLTIRDIKKLLLGLHAARDLVMKKQYMAALMQPDVYERVMELIANRFGFLAPVGIWIARKVIARYKRRQS